AGAVTFLTGCIPGADALFPHSILKFKSIPLGYGDQVVVPEGYTARPFLPWGTPILSGTNDQVLPTTAAEQEKRMGLGHDGMWFFPLNDQGTAGVLCINQEFGDNSHVANAPGAPAIGTEEFVQLSQAVHGVAVVKVELIDGSWRPYVGSKYNRRITPGTPVEFSGPVAGTEWLQNPADNPFAGTVNNCANGKTPWGTYLTCEENFNGYFGANGDWTPDAAEDRYGLSAGGFGYGWHVHDPRFDLSNADYANEHNRFGWVVEIDPMDASSTPVKRTALGRFKHEGATVTEQQGRIVVYSGDDENGDYLYKFVGNAPWRQLRAQGKSPLDEGTLYVARFAGDGTGTWLPLVHGTGPLGTANGFADQADVLIRTRQAADAVGATRLHRPEWVAVNERTGDVFVTLTNGSGNNAEVNSGRNPNNFGHIVRFRDVDNVHAPTAFTWDVFLFAGDPAYPALGGTKVPADQPLFGSPDGIWVDPDGLVWIQTDISNSAQNLSSRGYDRIGNNQMLVADPDSGDLRRFLTGPRGCEITGVVTTPDQRTMFVNVQHPGESTTFWNNIGGAPTTTNPRSVSNWPEHLPGGRPRPATVVIRKIDGGRIGS
ncbi:MAG: PhoX family phosphatase, partial [Acidimicrobiales bacterium]|nr:PhoX family phosphatase [Acidimicrobiales bacterium]